MMYAFHSGEAAAHAEQWSHQWSSHSEASSVLFTILECGEPRAVGHWRQAGTYEGRPSYANVADSQVVIRWSEGASAWQLATTSVLGATVLYESEYKFLEDFHLLQEGDQWKIAAGYFGRPAAKGPVPKVVWKDHKHSLRETSSPCENVYAGVKLTDATGKVRAPICLKDVGESCIEPIKKCSWAPGVLWQQTYEGMIDDENRTIAQLQDRVASQRQDIEEKHLQLAEESDPRAKTTLLKGIEATEELVRRNEQKITPHEASRAALADATCWSGGKPNASRGNVGRE